MSLFLCITSSYAQNLDSLNISSNSIATLTELLDSLDLYSPSVNFETKEEYENFISLYDMLLTLCRMSEPIDAVVEIEKKSLPLYKDFYGGQSLEYATKNVYLGSDFLQISDYDNSLVYLQNGVDIYSNFYKDNLMESYKDPTYQRAIWLLAGTLAIKGEYLEAIKWREFADKAFKFLGEKEFEKDYCVNLYFLMEHYYATGQYLSMGDICDRLKNIIRSYFSVNSKQYFRFLLCSLYKSTYHGDKAEALELASEIQGLPNRSIVSGLYLEAFVYLSFREYSKAIELLENCIQYEGQVNNESELEYICKSYNALASVLINYDLNKAEVYVNKALSLNKGGIDGTDLIEATFNLGRIAHNKRDYITSLECFDKALKLSIEGNHFHCIATCLCESARSEFEIGNFAQAVYKLEEAKRIVETKIGITSSLYSHVLQNMTIFYSHIGDTYKSRVLTSDIARVHKTIYGPNSTEYAVSLYNIALHEKNDSTAISLFNEVIQILQDSDQINNELFAKVHNEIGIRLFNIGDKKGGQRAFKQSYKVLQESKLTKSATAINYHLNYGFCVLHDSHKSAKKHFSKAYDIALNQGLQKHPLFFKSLFSSGLISFIHGIPDDQYIKEMINSLELTYQLNFGLYNESERSQIWFDLLKLKDIVLSCHHNDNYNSSMYDYALISKGLLLNTYVAFSNALQSSDDKNLRALYSDYRDVSIQIAELESKPISNSLVSIDSLKNIASNIERQLIHQSPQYREHIQKMRISWKLIQEKLSANEIAIEFVQYKDYSINYGQEMYAALVLKKGYERPKHILLCEKNKIDSLLYCGKQKEYAIHINDLYSSEELYKYIWEPLENELDKNSTIYFSPDGSLYSLAIEYLPDKNGVIAEDKYNLIRLSSTRNLTSNVLNTEQTYTNAILYGGIDYDVSVQDMQMLANQYNNISLSLTNDYLAGNRDEMNYLHGTRREIMSISEILQYKNIPHTLLTNKLANEESFKNLSHVDFDILHIATHGFYIPSEERVQNNFLNTMSRSFQEVNSILNFDSTEDAMYRSGLAFAGANNTWKGKQIQEGVDDGIATSAEIASINFTGVDLVILSACETGLGEVNDEGVFGLQRAFKKAGANTIIMSLWKVNDHITQMMMTSFYGHLLRGKTKRDSFRLAQQEIRAEYPNPYQWAAFIMLD